MEDEVTLSIPSSSHSMLGKATGNWQKQHSKREKTKNMMPKRKSVIQQVIVLLTVYATICSWSAVSDSLKGAAEKLIDERLQTESLFKTAESTPPTLTTSKPSTFNADMKGITSKVPPLTDCGSGWYQQLGLQFLEVLQATYVGFSFNPVCEAHDACYRDVKCRRDKSECDRKLLADAEGICETAWNRAICIANARIFFQAVSKFGYTPFEKARANCPATKYAVMNPLDDATIKSTIINRLKDYIPIDLIGNYAGGTNGVVEEVEILEKSYEKEQLNAIGKAFLGEPKNYWGVVVRVKGHGQVGFNSMVAGMMSGDPDSKRSFNSITKYRFFDAGGGSWSLVSPEELRP